MNRICAVAATTAAVLVLLASPVGAAVYTLTDANSSSVVDTGPGGMTSWTVDGVQHLARQWFWYRVGAGGGETNVGALSLISATQLSPDYLRLMYQGSSFTIELKLTLTGGSPGSGTSDIGESIKIVNTGATPLDFHFFQYVDLNLNGQAVNSSVEIVGGNTAVQTNGLTTVSETVETPTASRYEVGFAPGTLTSLTDGSPTTLSNMGGPIGPGDLTWAFQWDRALAAGGSFLISKDKHIVPEPATLCLLALGALGAMRRRGR
ncbi:MAG: PEP-CTERM sorting domain-containing protein [Planctomycetota bacterium]|nr:PEP-CTERM sorting domain-containing protein [Planctomycetota bacterium]